MQNAIQKFRQSSIVFQKTGILSENLKTLSSNYPTVQYFFAETPHTCKLLLTNIYKRVCGIFFISFRLQKKIYKKLKRPGFYTLVFYTFINNSRSKQNKKYPTHTCRHY